MKPAPASLRILLATLLGGAVLFLAALLYWFDPQQHGFYPRCLLHEITGWNCAGCGSLRATHALLHGDIATALHCNVLLVAGAVLGLTWMGYALWKKLSGQPAGLFQLNPLQSTWLLLGVTLAFSILRNLPGPIFTGLNP